MTDAKPNQKGEQLNLHCPMHPQIELLNVLKGGAGFCRACNAYVQAQGVAPPKPAIEKIRCDEPNCTCIVAERRADGTIVIRARHHGETHVTIISPWPSTSQQDLAADAVKPLMASDTSILQ